MTANQAVEHFDAILIGTGQGAKPLAAALAGAGRKTAIVERAAVGGSCINYGCTPTKTMVASARVAWLAGRAADYGVHVGDVRVAMDEVRERKRRVVERFRSGSEKRLQQTDGLELIRGQAAFTGPKTVEISLASGGARHLTAERIFINTGLRPARPPIEGLDDVPLLDNASIMELDHVPEHLIVLGGGYVGLEFGQMFRRFGSRVTIVDRGEHLLGKEDPDIAEAMAGILRDDGIEIRLQSTARRVRRDAGGAIEIELASGDKRSQSSRPHPQPSPPSGGRGQGEGVRGSHLLLSAGRVPNTDELNLAAAGIETDGKGFIRVNDRLETNVPGVYALGDVKGGPAFTHVSYNDYLVLKTNLLDGGNASIQGRPILYTVFTDPELGRVGLTETEAREQGRNIGVARIQMSHVARAIEADETRGVMKAVVDVDSEEILGAAVLGVHGGEIMSQIQIAMMGRLPYTALRDAMFAHPVLAEALNTLFGSVQQ